MKKINSKRKKKKKVNACSGHNPEISFGRLLIEILPKQARQFLQSPNSGKKLNAIDNSCSRVTYLISTLQIIIKAHTKTFKLLDQLLDLIHIVLNSTNTVLCQFSYLFLEKLTVARTFTEEQCYCHSGIGKKSYMSYLCNSPQPKNTVSLFFHHKLKKSSPKMVHLALQLQEQSRQISNLAQSFFT